MLKFTVPAFAPPALVAALAVLGPAAPADARVTTAQCVIESSGGGFRGPCRFASERGGSFSVERADGGALLDGVTLVSLAIVEPGVGEVRGLTQGGLSARWGMARRSARDPACWIGDDFSLCAY